MNSPRGTKQQTSGEKPQISSPTGCPYLAYDNPDLKKYSSEECSERLSKKIELAVVNKQYFVNGYNPVLVTNSDDTVGLTSRLQKTPNFEMSLVQLHKLDELLAFSQKVFTGQQRYLAQRIQELLDLCAEDDEVIASVSSLKSMLLFLLKLTNFSPPGMTVSEDGLFHLHWKKESFHLVTLRFKVEHLDYVVFLPSRESNHPIVLNGKIGILDFHQVFVEQTSAIRNLIVGY